MKRTADWKKQIGADSFGNSGEHSVLVSKDCKNIKQSIKLISSLGLDQGRHWTTGRCSLPRTLKSLPRLAWKQASESPGVAVAWARARGMSGVDSAEVLKND